MKGMGSERNHSSLFSRLPLHLNEDGKENHPNFQHRWLAFRKQITP